jgi:hypothetical protein
MWEFVHFEEEMHVHTNLRLIYRQREEWLKGKTKRDVFPNDMGLLEILKQLRGGGGGGVN